MSYPSDTPLAFRATLDAITDADHRDVTRWVLEEMADTFLVCAFADACDDCDEAARHAPSLAPHPDRPGPGGAYEDAMPEPADEVRTAAEHAAATLYARILAHYDPAPALLRWWLGDGTEEGAGHDVSRHWREKFSPCHAAAACWGHYAVMQAMGHGVGWSDDYDPLTDAKGRELPAVGYHIGCSTDGIYWSDEHTDAARMELDAREDERRAASDVDGVE